MADVTIKLVKGLAGKKKDQIAVCQSLGLRKTAILPYSRITLRLAARSLRSNIWLRLLTKRTGGAIQHEAARIDPC